MLFVIINTRATYHTLNKGKTILLCFMFILLFNKFI